jgi:anti-anti-sigma factor
VIGTFVNSRTNQEFQLEDSPTTVGRHEANMIRLRGFAISRFHAEVGQTPEGTPYLEDMGSTYGTYVNGHKVEGRVSLHDGDEVLMGVSSGFPNGEYGFIFRKPPAGAATTAKQRKKPPTRHQVREGTAKLNKSDDAYVFHLDGIFRRKECDSLASEVMGLVGTDPRDVVLELSRVEYMNSYGLGMLVRLSQDVESEEAKVAIAGAQGLVLKLFQTVGLDRKLGSYPTVDDAVKALGQQG